MKSFSPQTCVDKIETKMTSNHDTIARMLSFIALSFGILALIASISLSPWLHFEISQVKDYLHTKADLMELADLKEQMESLKGTVMELKIRLADESAIAKPRFNFRNATRFRAKRQAGKAKNPPPESEDNYGVSSYVRWGRTECRNGAVTVYSGVAGGGYSGHAGGGSNYVCLPNDPEFDYINPGVQYATSVGGSSIYGVEFKLNNIDPFDNKFNRGKSLNGQDSTCARCMVPGKNAVIVIPAKVNCPIGWTKEYKGYMMAPHYKQHRMNYVCVDEAPMPRNAGETTTGGLFWYPVEVQCGAIPCPKYSNGNELNCVVCSK